MITDTTPKNGVNSGFFNLHGFIYLTRKNTRIEKNTKELEKIIIEIFSSIY